MATRPTFTVLQPGTEAWLADFNDAIDALFNTPLPLPQFANEAALPSALLYEDCIAHVIDVDDIFKSDGALWIPQPKRAASQPNSSGWTDATAQGDFNALLAILRTAHAMET